MLYIKGTISYVMLYGLLRKRMLCFSSR